MWTMGQYAGKPVKWLLEHDLGYVFWLLRGFVADTSPQKNLQNWQKRCLLEQLYELTPVWNQFKTVST